jgi:hypothetical protein
MVEAVKGLVQGVQVTAPAGRIDAALEVLGTLSVSGKREKQNVSGKSSA